MMAVRGMRPSEAIGVVREDWIDRVLDERRIDREKLAAASRHVSGERLWFALRATHRGELELRQRLIDSDVDAVVPERQVQLKARRAGARGKLIHKPVIDGLVFVCIVPSDDAFVGLLRVKGVAALIGTGERPHPISVREMNAFMDLAQKGAFDERNTPTGLKVGSRVAISVGPYADFEGVLEGYAKGRVARVSMKLFGGPMTVDVTLAHLKNLD
jgi:transcription termination/antitermination protein NusG